MTCASNTHMRTHLAGLVSSSSECRSHAHAHTHTYTHTDLPGLPGVWATVRYLVTLGGLSSSTDAVPLIRKHAKWVLEADPDAGLQVSGLHS